MKHLSFISLIVLLRIIPLYAQTNNNFDKYFIDATMRIDYFHIGNAKEEIITLDRIYKQGIWASSTTNPIDTFGNGHYYAKIYDYTTNQMIFSKGYDSYFGEYKTTTAAIKGVKRTFHESVLIPYPKNTIQLTIEVRDRENVLHQIFSQLIDPKDMYISQKSLEPGVKIIELVKSGNPHEKADIAIIAEGYTASEEQKFRSDAERLAKAFFDFEPYKSRKSKFNFYAVLKASAESGVDEPSYGSFKNTVVNATFDSLGSERYLLTEDNKSLRDIAAHVPYDALMILVNTKRYGGGGLYNNYATVTSDNQWTKYVFLHEFGHSFVGLADEYYTSSTAYNEFYPQGIEPIEPNITALVDAGNFKWKDQCAPSIAIPTPWEKDAYDKMDNDYQKIRQEVNNKIAKLKREKAPESDIAKLQEESEKLSREHALKIDEFLTKSKFAGKVGVYEGAGYAAKGLYRPMIDCLMFTKGAKPFCKVCEHAVIQVIERYSR